MNVYTQAMPEAKRAAKQCGGAERIAVRDRLRIQRHAGMGANSHREAAKWLRGVDLNHRPLGYED
jgi:hypothetical protein